MGTETGGKPSWLQSWWPPFFFAGIIFVLSTHWFSSAHTAPYFDAILRSVYPPLDADQFYWAHHYARKSVHVMEYFAFYVLLYRAMRGENRGWHWNWASRALIIAVIYSVLDEIHQAFEAGRGASARDSLLDSIGAGIAMVALYWWFHVRKSKADPVTTSPSTSPADPA